MGPHAKTRFPLRLRFVFVSILRNHSRARNVPVSHDVSRTLLNEIQRFELLRNGAGRQCLFEYYRHRHELLCIPILRRQSPALQPSIETRRRAQWFDLEGWEEKSR
jgi:hypothetical protein